MIQDDVNRAAAGALPRAALGTLGAAVGLALTGLAVLLLTGAVSWLADPGPKPPVMAIVWLLFALLVIAGSVKFIRGTRNPFLRGAAVGAIVASGLTILLAGACGGGLA